MVKNWLIRTKNNHILGPVSREKIRELISNGSIKGDDEICSGNGYWIHVREQDLVARYVMGSEQQPFNPVQEAEPVFALSPNKDDLEYPKGEDKLPGNEDLEYPDREGSQTDATQIGLSLADLAPSLNPDEMDRDSTDPSKKKNAMTTKAKLSQEVPIPQLKRRNQSVAAKKELKRHAIFEGKNLIFLLIFFLTIAIYLFLNRSTFIKQIINYTGQVNIIPAVHAQTMTSSAKKKIGFTQFA